MRKIALGAIIGAVLVVVSINLHSRQEATRAPLPSPSPSPVVEPTLPPLPPAERAEIIAHVNQAMAKLRAEHPDLVGANDPQAHGVGFRKALDLITDYQRRRPSFASDPQRLKAEREKLETRIVELRSGQAH